MCGTCGARVDMPLFSSQRARASSFGKTPSFSFCQVDMYGCIISSSITSVSRLCQAAMPCLYAIVKLYPIAVR